MSTASGIAAQITYAKETVYGTPVATTHAPDFLSESIVANQARIESKGMRKGARFQRVGRRLPNPKGAAGDIGHEVQATGMGLIFEQMFGGSAVTTPSGATLARLQTFLAGGDPGSVTCQIGRPNISGTVVPYTYAGGRVTDWSWELDVDGVSTIVPSWDFQREIRTGQALASITVPAELPELLTFLEGTVTIGGVDVLVTKFSLKGSVGIKTDRYYVGNSGLKSAPISNALYAISGQVDLDFTNVDIDDQAESGETTDLSLALVGSQIEVGHDFGAVLSLGAIQWDGDTPNLNGEDTLVRSAKFTVLDNGTDPVAKLDYTTTDAAV